MASGSPQCVQDRVEEEGSRRVEGSGGDRMLNIEIVLHRSGRDDGGWKLAPSATLSLLKDVPHAPRRRPRPLEVVCHDDEMERGMVVSPASTLPATGVDYSVESSHDGHHDSVTDRTRLPAAHYNRDAGVSLPNLASSGSRSSNEKFESMRRRVFGIGHSDNVRPPAIIEQRSGEAPGLPRDSSFLLQNGGVHVPPRAAVDTEYSGQEGRPRAGLGKDPSTRKVLDYRGSGCIQTTDAACQCIESREVSRSRLEAADVRCAELEAEVELLRIGSDKVAAMEAELTSLAAEVDRLTVGLQEERRRNDVRCDHSNCAPEQIAQLGRLERRQEERKVTADGTIRDLQDSLMKERSRVSELELLLETAKNEIRLSKVNRESLQQHESIRNHSGENSVEKESDRREEGLIRVRREEGEHHESLSGLTSEGARTEAAEEKVQKLYQRVEELQQRVDEKATELISVSIERDELSHKLDKANERLSSAVEQIGILEAAVERESSQRQLLILQRHGLQEECDRLTTTVERLDRINTENILTKGQAGRRVRGYEEGGLAGRVINQTSLDQSCARQLITMSLEDYNAECTRVAEVTEQLLKERRTVQRLLDEVRQLRLDKRDLEVALRGTTEPITGGVCRPAPVGHSNSLSGTRPVAGRSGLALPTSVRSIRTTDASMTTTPSHHQDDSGVVDSERLAPIPHALHKAASISVSTTRPLLPPNLGSPNPSALFHHPSCYPKRDVA